MDDRRDFLKSAGAAFTTSLFTGNVKGANDRPRVSVIGMGRMGMSNLGFAMRQPGVEIASVCDVYQPHLEQAVAFTGRGPEGTPDSRPKAKGIADFREVLADKSVDIVCRRHARPLASLHDRRSLQGRQRRLRREADLRRHRRRPQDGGGRPQVRPRGAGRHQQRSGVHFQKAAEIVRSGKLGKITFCRTWNYGNALPQGIGNPADAEPPAGLDWDMWLGPAPMRPFNENRFGVDPNAFSHFRWFWDYAGGMMTDWGVHLLDIVQMAFNETPPTAITSLGGKYYLQDNTETPDTLQVTYQYPNEMICTYEYRAGNGQSMFNQGYGILFHGTKGTLFVDRSLYRLIPEKGSDLEAVEEKSSNNHNMAHWANFMECVKNRWRPVSDIEIGHRSTSTAILGNMSYRSKLRVDWDGQKETTPQAEARQYLKREYRKPWKLEV